MTNCVRRNPEPLRRQTFLDRPSGLPTAGCSHARQTSRTNATFATNTPTGTDPQYRRSEPHSRPNAWLTKTSKEMLPPEALATNTVHTRPTTPRTVSSNDAEDHPTPAWSAEGSTIPTTRKHRLRRPAIRQFHKDPKTTRRSLPENSTNDTEKQTHGRTPAKAEIWGSQ